MKSTAFYLNILQLKLYSFYYYRVQARVKTIPELENCKVEVLNIPRQNEPSNLSWKGAAIVSGTPVSN